MEVGRRRGLLAALLVLVLVASGCKVSSTVAVGVDGDGSGRVKVTVVLDEEAKAAAEAGATLEQRVLLDDLRKAGWRVTPWEQLANGDARIVFTKRFRDAEELSAVLHELDGGRFLHDLDVRRQRGLLRSSDELRLTVDLSAIKTGIAGDADFAQRLAASGIDVAAVDSTLSKGLADALAVTLRLQVRDEVRTVKVAPGTEQRVTVAGSSIRWDRAVWLGLGAVSALLSGLLVLAVAMGRRGRRRRRARADSAADPVPTW